MTTIPTTVPAAATAIDPRHYREVMGHYPTGVAVVTGFDVNEPIGMVVGTFSAVSMDPPLVTFMPQRSSGTYSRMRGGGPLCINVLAYDQLETCRTMATPGIDKFADVAWENEDGRAPQLHDAVAYIHARTLQEIEAGDHWIVLCEVTAMEVARPVTPLLFFQGGYGDFSPHGMTARGDADVITAINLAEPARRAVASLASRLACEVSALVGLNEDELITAVSSYGGNAAMNEPLGQRLPLIPPIGEAYVAGSTPEVVERWLSKISDPAESESYRERLETVERRGVAVSVVRPDQVSIYEELTKTLGDYSVEKMTPARMRSVAEALTRTRCFFRDVELVESERYDIASLLAPVRDPNGGVLMVLRARQLPPNASGATVQRWINSLKDACRQVEVQLSGGLGKSRLDDYREWYASEFPM